MKKVNKEVHYMLILKKKNIIITSILIAITLGITFLLIFMCNNVLKKEEEANKTNPQLIYEALKKEDRIFPSILYSTGYGVRQEQ